MGPPRTRRRRPTANGAPRRPITHHRPPADAVTTIPPATVGLFRSVRAARSHLDDRGLMSETVDATLRRILADDGAVLAEVHHIGAWLLYRGLPSIATLAARGLAEPPDGEA